jgi:hypothetical protein
MEELRLNSTYFQSQIVIYHASLQEFQARNRYETDSKQGLLFDPADGSDVFFRNVC